MSSWASAAKAAVETIKQDATTGKADVFKWWTLMTVAVLSSVAFGEPFQMVENGQKSQLVHDIEQATIFGGLRWLAGRCSGCTIC